MRVSSIKIENFRGIKNAELILPSHGVLIGDNNTGKTTVLEALDLALGPDRLNRYPPIDEHDFYNGVYTTISNTSADEEQPAEIEPTEEGLDQTAHDSSPKIEIEVTVVDLTFDQLAIFGDYVEFWDVKKNILYEMPDPKGVDARNITPALRVTSQGWYDAEEDDFEARTVFTRSLTESTYPVVFTKKHKQLCGFLYLRSIRTGSRALSLERGSLLDIILRLKDVRPQMWEDTINTLSKTSVASNPNLGISPVLESINAALSKYVPREWGIEPQLKISNLTREHLRKLITAFIATGDGNHSAPFYRQGTGTINMLVLAMLSQIAEDKRNVIFAMEEPETAIPPYAQKRIVHEVRKLASQTLFTSHSPYVLEEFLLEETVVLSRDSEGLMKRSAIALPDSVKLKQYRQNFRTRFCEGLLARRVLIAEGATEASAFQVACLRLSELNPELYSSIEALGVCIIDAGSESNIPAIASLYRQLGKCTFAICDLQDNEKKVSITKQVKLLLMHDEKGFEDMVINGTSDEALLRFAKLIDWPQHLLEKHPNPSAEIQASLRDYLIWSKGNGGSADFIAQCSEEEIPLWLRDAALRLKAACTPPTLVEDSDITQG